MPQRHFTTQRFSVIVEMMNRRTATLRLRGPVGSVEARLHAPLGAHELRLVVAFVEPPMSEALCSMLNGIVITLAPADATVVQPVVEWIAAHAAELGASTGVLAVTGFGDGATTAEYVVAAATVAGWPPVELLDLTRCHPWRWASIQPSERGTEMNDRSPTDENHPIPQGDLRLLTSANALLCSTIPARLAFIADDGTPRIVPSWFHWSGRELVMGTFVSAPHVVRPAARIRALQRRPTVAVTIDTDQSPPEVLTLRGDAQVSEHVGIVSEYAEAARRYLGEEAAAGYLAMLDHPSTVMARIAVTPAWVGLIDFQSRMPAPLGGVQSA